MTCIVRGGKISGTPEEGMRFQGVTIEYDCEWDGVHINKLVELCFPQLQNTEAVHAFCGCDFVRKPIITENE